MPYVVEIHPDAIQEAANAVEWYTARSQHAAEAFTAELDQAVKIISESPERWPTYVLRRFPFAVV